MSEPVLLRPSSGPSSSPDSVAASTGVVSESEHQSLRADIRRLSTMLGQALAHHGGPELLELVEKVRRLSRHSPESGRAEITNALSGLDSGTVVALSRAFSLYFQLANTAEQLHRSHEPVFQPRGPQEALAAADGSEHAAPEASRLLARQGPEEANRGTSLRCIHQELGERFEVMLCIGGTE